MKQHQMTHKFREVGTEDGNSSFAPAVSLTTSSTLVMPSSSLSPIKTTSSGELDTLYSSPSTSTLGESWGHHAVLKTFHSQ